MQPRSMHCTVSPMPRLQMHGCIYAVASPLLDCRTFLEMFHGTLFQNMEDLLSFIQYSHSACLKSNKLKKRSILKLGTDTTCSRMVLSEVLVFSCMNVAVLHNMQSCTLGL